MTFEDFQNTQEYRDLDTLQKMQAASAYYDQKVAPSVPEEYRDAGKQAFIEQKTPDALKTVVGGAHAFVSNIGNLESELEAKAGINPYPEGIRGYVPFGGIGAGKEAATQAYEKSPQRQETENLNTQEAKNVALSNVGSGTVNVPYMGQVGAGNLEEMLGQSIPILATAGPIGEAAAGAYEGGAAGIPIIEKIAPWAARVETAGAVGGAGQAANAPTVNQSLEKSQENIGIGLLAAPAMDVGFRAPGLFTRGISAVSNFFSRAGNKLAVGKEFNANLTPEEQAKLSQYTSTPQEEQPYNLNTTAITESPFAFSKASEIRNKKFNMGNGKVLQQRVAETEQNQQVKSQLAGELGGVNEPNANSNAVQEEAGTQVQKEQARINSPLTFQEMNLGKPGEVANAPSTTETSGGLAKEVYQKIYAADEAQKAAHAAIDPGGKIQILPGKVAEVAGPITTLAEDDPVLGKISENYTDVDTPVSVRQMLDDKNALNEYVHDKVDERANGSTDKNLSAKINAAMELNTAIKDRLSSDNTPSAIPGKTVGEAFNEAQKGTEQFYRKYLENTNGLPGKININPDTGEVETSFYPLSPVGKMYRAAKASSAAPEALEGRKIFDPTKPDTFVTSIRNIANVKDVEPSVKQGILSHINEASDDPIKAFDKVYTKDIDTALRNNGFGKTADDLTALRNNLGAENQTLESQNALLKMGKERAQTDLDASTATKLYSKGNPLTQDQIANIVLKSPESKADALNLVNSANDNGASRRGLGQILLNKLKKDAISTGERTLGNQPAEQINATKLNQLLTEHGDILEKTLGKDALDAVKKINDIASKVQYSETGAFKELPENASPEERLAHALAIQIGTKARLFPPSEVYQAVGALKSFRAGNYYKVLQEAQNPYVAQELLTAAKNKNPNILQSVLDAVSRNATTISAVATPQTIKGSNFPEQTQQNKEQNIGPQSSTTNAATATTAALQSSKKNMSFADYLKPIVDYVKPIGEADAAEIHQPESGPLVSKVEDFTHRKEGQALQKAIRQQGQNATEIMTMVDTESSVNKANYRDYGQMTGSAWKQAEKILGKPLDRKNTQDYADAVVAYYKWTAGQVKKVLGTAGTPSVRDVYIAYNAGIDGFKKLMSANKNAIAADIVGSNTAKNNKAFYYGKNGKPLTVSQTIRAYHNTIANKMNEVYPISDNNPNSKLTTLALNQARG